MPPMQSLRHATFLARLVLAWFVLSLGVMHAAAAATGGLELVCSTGAGLKLLAKDSQGEPVNAMSAAADCPLCASGAALPPPACPATATPPSLTELHMRSARIDWMPATPAAPLPARGPPSAATAC